MPLKDDPEVFEPRASQRTVLRGNEIRLPAADGTVVLTQFPGVGRSAALQMAVEVPGEVPVVLGHARAYAADDSVAALLLGILFQCQELRRAARERGM